MPIVVVLGGAHSGSSLLLLVIQFTGLFEIYC